MESNVTRMSFFAMQRKHVCCNSFTKPFSYKDKILIAISESHKTVTIRGKCFCESQGDCCLLISTALFPRNPFLASIFAHKQFKSSSTGGMTSKRVFENTKSPLSRV